MQDGAPHWFAQELFYISILLGSVNRVIVFKNGNEQDGLVEHFAPPKPLGIYVLVCVS